MPQTNRVYASGWTRMIAEATDHDTAMRFVLAFGGRRHRFAVAPKEDSRIAQAIGFEAARKLSARFGDERIEVPLERANLIFWLRDQDKSEEDISHALRISRRTVQHRLNGTVPRFDDAAQPELEGAIAGTDENIHREPESVPE